MSKKDFFEGLKAQAKINAKKDQKIEEGLKAIEDKIEGLSEDQEDAFDVLNEVLEDVSDIEVQSLYGLTAGKRLDELDLTEKRVVCAAIYTLLASHGQKADTQISFYLNLEDHLGIKERNDKFDLTRLENIDSHADRIVIGKAICAFLFLGDSSFGFVGNKEQYEWLYDFLPEKEINKICSSIEKQYRVLGRDGLIDLFKLPAERAPDSSSEEPTLIEEKHGTDDPVLEEVQAPEDYSLLKTIVLNHIAKRDEFGKFIDKYPDVVKKELTKAFPDLSYDAVIGMTKISSGYLTFTTYGMYIKDGNLFRGEYKCLPYKDIIIPELAMSDGKVAGTRKLIIPYKDADGVKQTISIDDGTLTEESLRDLLKDIHNSSCNTSPTDRFIKIGQLNKEQLKTFLSLLTYILKKNDANLSEVFVLSVLLRSGGSWNDIVDTISNHDDFENVLATFKQSIPYPSENAVLKGALKIILSIVTGTNRIAGKESTFISDAAEHIIREFDIKLMDNTRYSKYVSKFKNCGPITSARNYEFIKEEILTPEYLYSDEIKEGVEKAIIFINSQPQEKAKKILQERTAPVAGAIKNGTEKAKGNFKGKKKGSTKEEKSERKTFSYIPRTEDEPVKIPESYDRFDTTKIPDVGAPEGTLGYTIATGNATGIVLCYPVSAESAMPFDEPNKLVDFLHDTMNENQGIIEVQNGDCKNGGKYIYYIMKYRRSAEDISLGGGYQLNFNFIIDNTIYFISGSFDEAGITGVRDSTAYALIVSAKRDPGDEIDVENLMENGWFCDPYDPDYKKGFRMNLSEKPGLDEMFPEHPLSVARALVKYVINNN